jgi:flagellar biosynthesis protein FliP
MTKKRWQFSVRQLLVVMTVVAIVVMLVTHHFRLIIGFVTVAFWLADPFFPFRGTVCSVVAESKAMASV